MFAANRDPITETRRKPATKYDQGLCIRYALWVFYGSHCLFQREDCLFALEHLDHKTTD